MKTSGQLLLGIAKIYYRQIIYLNQDCNETISTFILPSRQKNNNLTKKIKNISSTNVNRTLNVLKYNIFNDWIKLNFRNNQSKIEDITIQPPQDFLSFYNDSIFNENIESEIMRFNSNLRNDISYEVARDQSIIPDLTLDQSDILNNDLTFEKSQLLQDPLMLSNISDIPDLSNIPNISNISNIGDFNDFDIPNDLLDIDQNPNIDSVLNNVTIGSSINISKKTFDQDANLERLSKILLDPIKGKSKLSRKRRLIIDDVKVISNKEIENEILSFKKFNNTYKEKQFDVGKENIPPINYNFMNDEMPLMSITNNISKPLALKCSNLINSKLSFNYHETFAMNQTNNDTENNIQSFGNLDEIDDYNNETLHDNLELNNIENNLENNPENNFESYNFENNVESYNYENNIESNFDNDFDKFENTWSETTILMAKDLKSMTNDKTVTFKTYLSKKNETVSRKSIAQSFYSLLILQKENAFKLKQDVPYGDILVSAM